VDYAGLKHLGNLGLNFMLLKIRVAVWADVDRGRVRFKKDCVVGGACRREGVGFLK